MKIVFDLDGTLIDVSKRHWGVYSKILQSYGKSSLPYEQYWGLKRENTPWPIILQQSDFVAGSIGRFMDEFIHDIELTENLKIDTVFSDTFSTLELLKDHELFLVSLRRNDAHLRSQLDWLKLTSYFSEIHSGHTEAAGHHKKNEIIKDIAHDQNVVVVGDTETDILAAQSLKLKSIAVTTGIRSNEFLYALKPDYIVSRLKEVASIINA